MTNINILKQRDCSIARRTMKPQGECELGILFPDETRIEVEHIERIENDTLFCFILIIAVVNNHHVLIRPKGCIYDIID